MAWYSLIFFITRASFSAENFRRNVLTYACLFCSSRVRSGGQDTRESSEPRTSPQAENSRKKADVRLAIQPIVRDDEVEHGALPAAARHLSRVVPRVEIKQTVFSPLTQVHCVFR